MTWVQLAASERIAVPSVESYACLWRLKDLSFRAGMGSRQLGHITSTDPTAGALCNWVVCVVKTLHALMLIAHAAGTPHFFGMGRGIPEVFAEELLQKTHCFLEAQKGQLPLHREEVLGQLQQTHLQHLLFHGPTLWRSICCVFSSGLSQVIIWGFSWPVLMPRGYSSECCSTTEQKDKICSKNLQS